MEDNDLPLHVPLLSLTDYLQCTICLCTLDNTTVTKCGHRYCEKCISEWVNRQHTCPCCNQSLDQSHLIKDHQFDSMLSTIKKEKEKAESEYFEVLIKNASDERQESDTKPVNPVEHVLKKHLKEGLIAHESYFQKLRKSYQTKVTELETSTDKAVLDLSSHGLSQQEVELQTQGLQTTLARRKEDLKGELDTCAQLVAEAYDKYLSNHIPKLDVLPVKASIILTEKSNMKIPDVIFSPSDTIDTIKVAVETSMLKKHNPVHLWGDDVRFFLFGPFAKCTECEMDTVIKSYLSHGNLLPDVHLLTEGGMLGLQYGMKPGSCIVVYGSVQCESDLPKRCFVEMFDKANPTQKVDYFSCAQCSFKWICRSCMESCHQGHETSPYIMQHQPAWACCYCPKKKMCKIIPGALTS